VPERKGFDLGDYVEVKDRIRIFYELFAQGRLVTTHVASELGPDGKPRVIVEAAAYRSPDDPLPGRGWSWMELPGTSNYTRGSELENTETSAWGRAIASLGILIDRSIASGQEVQNKQSDQPHVVTVGTQPVELSPTAVDDGGLIGTAIAQGNHDFNLRQTPSGWALPFRVKNGAKSFIVRAEDDLAQALYNIKETVIDQRVTVWGHWQDQTIPAKGTKPEIKYRVLVLTRIATPDGILPAPAWDTPPPEEAESVPLFDPEEEETISAALAKVPDVA